MGKVRQALELLYKDTLSEVAIRKSRSLAMASGETGFNYTVERNNRCYDRYRGTVLFGRTYKDIPKQGVRTYQTAENMMKDFKYFTPNSFFKARRKRCNLRWLNAMVIDVDNKCRAQNEQLSLEDIMDKIQEAHLPIPTFIVQTPSNGYHVYFCFENSVRATTGSLYFYGQVQRQISKAILGDRFAIGSERWFRCLTEDNIISLSRFTVSFSQLIDWLKVRWEEQGIKLPKNRVKSRLVKKYGFEHPAIQKLLEGVKAGRRNHACYTLALFCKQQGKSEGETLAYLLDWNTNNSPRMETDEVKACVISAFKTDAPMGPSAQMITELSGIRYYRQHITPAKPRAERTYSHFNEWEQDMLERMEEQKEISGSQKELAAFFNMPESSYKIVVKKLVEKGLIAKQVIGRGCRAKTILTRTNIEPFDPNKNKQVKSKGKSSEKKTARHEQMKQEKVTPRKGCKKSEKRSFLHVVYSCKSEAEKALETAPEKEKQDVNNSS